MYCGGEPEHHTRNILIAHKHVSCTCHELNLQALQLTCLQMIGARYYKFHAELTDAPCFNKIALSLDKIIIH